MECKYWRSLGYMWEILELIETLWNVNHIGMVYGDAITLELIETLWNVNTQSSRKLQTASGINRNIVECKYER